MNRRSYAPWLLAACTALFVFLALPWPLAASGDARPVRPGDGAARPPPSTPDELRLGEMGLDPDSDRYTAPMGPGRAVLTLVPRVQGRIEKFLADYRVPWAAAVLIEPATGRVLAMAEHSQRDPSARGLSLQARAPAASVFKIVTSAALLQRGFEPDAEVCFHGGHHRVQRNNLADDPRRDRRCLTLASALGHSANVVFAKLADRALDAGLLRASAERLLFNTPIPFPQPVETSRADIPEDPFALATTAAGFGPVRLSPLHGALLAAIVANGGVFVPPEVLSSVDGARAPQQPGARRVLDERVAADLAAMMRTTVTEGTARQIFGQRRWRRSALQSLTVAGKTGSLSEPNPYRDYSWFVGFAPVEHPRVAFAVVVMNERAWRIKAPAVARAALEAWSEWEWGQMQASAAPVPGGRAAP